jgi:phosphate:Na+ symporter
MNHSNWILISLNFIAGISLFLLGVSKMSEGMKAIASDKMKQLLSKFTTNIFAAIATGAIATTILDSSSVVIIMVIALVNAKLLTLKQSLEIILGSNIGTAVGSQIIAFNVGEYAAIPLLVGLILFLSAKKKQLKEIGKSILGLGLIFFGLYYIGSSAEPLKTMPAFSNLILQIETPYKGAIAGAITTLLIQSSSATLGIVISLANQQLITLSASIAVMFGAELGTCSSSLIASIGRSRDAIRVGVFHLFFNVVSLTLGLTLIKPFISLINSISGSSSLARQIANAHVLFNILGVLIFVAFVPILSKLLVKIIPEKHVKNKKHITPV